ncbi:MAG: photosynthetic complex putative assembly protein PuhB [Pseudomonadota bacterium]
MEEDSDFNFEPVRGLPSKLPPGEEILWQGAPDWRVLLWRALFAKLVVLWFGLMIAWQLAGLALGKLALDAALASILFQGVLCAAAVGILAVVAWATAKVTVYTITNRRLVLRFGLAVDLSINLPFAQIVNLDLVLRPDGNGDIAVGLKDIDTLSYLHLWPYARPWHLKAPQPMLRAVPDAQQVGQLLAGALRARLAELGMTDAISAGAGQRPDAPSGPTPNPALHPAE